MGATTTQQQSLASLSYNKTHKTILSFPQQLPTNQSIKMQFFAIAATFFAAVMAAPSAKPLMDPTTTTVGQLLSSAVSTRSCLAATVTMRHPAPQLAPPTCSSSCQPDWSHQPQPPVQRHPLGHRPPRCQQISVSLSAVFYSTLALAFTCGYSKRWCLFRSGLVRLNIL